MYFLIFFLSLTSIFGDKYTEETPSECQFCATSNTTAHPGFFEGMELLDSPLPKKVQEITCYKRFNPQKDPENYNFIKNLVEAELEKASNIQDPTIQIFCNTVKDWIKNGGPLAYNDRLHVKMCTIEKETLSSNERLISEELLDLTCDAAELFLDPDISNFYNLAFIDAHPNGMSNPLLEEIAHEAVLFPVDTIGEIGLVPLIQLILKNVHPLALHKGYAHGLEFSPPGFFLHDYGHFLSNSYFSNLSNLCEGTPKNRKCFDRANQLLMDFTQHWSNAILQGTTEEVDQGKRLIIALFIALHEEGDDILVLPKPKNLAETVIQALTIETCIRRSNFIDDCLKTSLLDGSPLAEHPTFEKCVKTSDRKFQTFTIAEDKKLLHINFMTSNGTVVEIYPTNCYHQANNEDFLKMLELAHIKSCAKNPIHEFVSHEEAYDHFSENVTWMTNEMNHLLHQLKEALLDFETTKGYPSFAEIP